MPPRKRSLRAAARENASSVYRDTNATLSETHVFSPRLVNQFMASFGRADPTFAPGHCLRAGLAVMASDRGAVPMLAESVAAIESLVGPFAAAPLEGLPPFQCGAAGYLAYDWGATLERLPSPRYDDLGLDDIVFGIYDWVLAWDHAAGRVWLISNGFPEKSLEARMARAKTRAARPCTRKSWRCRLLQRSR